MDSPLSRLLCPRNFLGKDTGVGSHSLLQGIFLTQGSKLRLLHCRQILYRLSYEGYTVLHQLNILAHASLVAQ